MLVCAGHLGRNGASGRAGVGRLENGTAHHEMRRAVPDRLAGRGHAFLVAHIRPRRTPAHPDWICGSQQRCMPRPPEPPVELCSGPADCQVIIIINSLFVSNI